MPGLSWFSVRLMIALKAPSSAIERSSLRELA